MSTASGDAPGLTNRAARSRRAKRRLTCSFSIGGQFYRGITLDLSIDGMFIQTDSTSAPGSAIEIDLIGPGQAPDVHVRGVIARRRAVPAMLASAVRRGIGVRILEAPREYGLLFQDALLDAPIQQGGRRRGPKPLTPEPQAPAPEPPAPSHEPVRETPAEPASPAPSAVARRKPEPPELAQPDVLLMDDGSLGDLASLLEEIGAEGLQIRVTRGSSPNAWVRPRRLLLTSASLALCFPWPECRGAHGFAGIAIADDDSQTLSARIARLGFRHLVRRTTHPEVLRFLLRDALYRGAERRRVPRFGLDCKVLWRAGLRPRSATLVDLSTRGCRLVVPSTAVAVRSFVKLTLAPDPMSRPGPTLRGRVARREPVKLPDGQIGLALAIVFERPSKRARRRLDALLARCAEGHVQPARSPLALAPFLHAARPTPTTDAPPGVPHEPDESPLLGSGISVLGARTASLRAGQRFALELYEGPFHGPLRIAAEICPADDDEGFSLRFAELLDEPELPVG